MNKAKLIDEVAKVTCTKKEAVLAVATTAKAAIKRTRCRNIAIASLFH